MIFATFLTSFYPIFNLIHHINPNTRFNKPTTIRISEIYTTSILIQNSTNQQILGISVLSYISIRSKIQNLEPLKLIYKSGNILLLQIFNRLNLTII